MEAKISKSALNLYLSCNRKYWFSLQGLPKVTTADMQYGIDLHEILHHVNYSLRNANNIGYMNNDIYKVEDWEPFYGNYRFYLDTVLPTMQKLGYDIKNISSEEEIIVGDYKGYIDAVLKNKDGKVLIVDFKTQSLLKVFDRENYKLELYFYIYLYTQKYSIPLEQTEGAIVRFEQKTQEGDINFL